MDSAGYVYCFSNPSFVGIVKIGMTTRYIEERLQEANHCGTWGPPTPYVIEFAKKVNNPKEKEKVLHSLLEKYSERVNANREFFKISVIDARLFFDLIDGEYWDKDTIIKQDEKVKEEVKESILFQPVICNTEYDPNINSKKFKYVCNNCCISTNNKQTYERHIDSECHKQFQEVNYSKYTCTKCNKKYNSDVGLYKYCKKCNFEINYQLLNKVQQLLDNFKNSNLNI
jgi:hypothetical protein